MVKTKGGKQAPKARGAEAEKPQAEKVEEKVVESAEGAQDEEDMAAAKAFFAARGAEEKTEGGIEVFDHAGLDMGNDLLEEEEETEDPKAFAEREAKKGIVYFARIPAFMQPQKLRHLMSQFGTVGRMFLTPEDKSIAKRRAKTGGSKKTKFTEGWVEFHDKKIARRVGDSLNNTPVGGKKRHNFYRDDIWATRYLPKFKWANLIEHRVYNNQVRKQRLQHQAAQQRRENAFYMEQVEKKKTVERIRNKQIAKAEKAIAEGKEAPKVTAGFKAPVKRRFNSATLGDGGDLDLDANPRKKARQAPAGGLDSLLGSIVG